MQPLCRGLLISVRILTIISIALYLIPTGAHLFERANKLALTPPQYMIAQRIYRGWALFGIVIAAALLLTLLHAIICRSRRAAFRLSLVAVVCLAATQVVFWLFTYPMNVVSGNWTVSPAHFDAARRQWENSHSASAVLTFVALLAITSAIVLDTSGPQSRSSGPRA